MPNKQPDVRIHKQKRRSMVMKITPVGPVVFIPEFLREDSPLVRKFIADALEKLNAQARLLPEDEQTSADELRLMVFAWAAKMGLEPKRVQIRDMYRKWGSCSSAGNITLNRALLRVDRPLAEYVVVHELVHMRVFNHGKEFKQMMSQYLPDWREREAILDKVLGGKPD